MSMPSRFARADRVDGAIRRLLGLWVAVKSLPTPTQHRERRNFRWHAELPTPPKPRHSARQ